jgi:hypothetical protein
MVQQRQLKFEEDNNRSGVNNNNNNRSITPPPSRTATTTSRGVRPNTTFFTPPADRIHSNLYFSNPIGYGPGNASVPEDFTTSLAPPMHLSITINDGEIVLLDTVVRMEMCGNTLEKNVALHPQMLRIAHGRNRNGNIDDDDDDDTDENTCTVPLHGTISVVLRAMTPNDSVDENGLEMPPYMQEYRTEYDVTPLSTTSASVEVNYFKHRMENSKESFGFAILFEEETDSSTDNTTTSSFTPVSAHLFFPIDHNAAHFIPENPHPYFISRPVDEFY